MFYGIGNLNPDFGRSIKSSIIYILVIISISSLTIPASITNNIKVTVASPLAPVQKIISQTSGFFKNRFKKLVSITSNAQKNEEMEKELFLLKNEIVKQQDDINVYKQKLEIVSKFKKSHYRSSSFFASPIRVLLRCSESFAAFFESS
jgi:cell shape-determining protein MreC